MSLTSVLVIISGANLSSVKPPDGRNGVARVFTLLKCIFIFNQSEDHCNASSPIQLVAFACARLERFLRNFLLLKLAARSIRATTRQRVASDKRALSKAKVWCSDHETFPAIGYATLHRLYANNARSQACDKPRVAFRNHHESRLRCLSSQSLKREAFFFFLSLS